MKTKTLLLLLWAVFAIITNAQDSTTVQFIYLDREQSLLNDLNNIQYTGFICNDTLAHDKKFLLQVVEYKNGKNIVVDSTDLDCKVEIIPMEVNGKTVNYRFDPCSRKTFLQSDSSFKVAVAGKLETDTFRLLIDYPGIRLTKKLKGSDNYSLRTISCDDNESTIMPFGKLTPIFAYTPPFETGKGMGSYCILGTEKVDNWFKEFGLKHYYIIYLLIE